MTGQPEDVEWSTAAGDDVDVERRIVEELRSAVVVLTITDTGSQVYTVAPPGDTLTLLQDAVDSYRVHAYPPVAPTD